MFPQQRVDDKIITRDGCSDHNSKRCSNEEDVASYPEMLVEIRRERRWALCFRNRTKSWKTR